MEEQLTLELRRGADEMSMRGGAALIQLSFGLCRAAALWVLAKIRRRPVAGRGRGSTEALAATNCGLGGDASQWQRGCGAR